MEIEFAYTESASKMILEIFPTPQRFDQIPLDIHVDDIFFFTENLCLKVVERQFFANADRQWKLRILFDVPN